jgi:hypothetical protein
MCQSIYFPCAQFSIAIFTRFFYLKKVNSTFGTKEKDKQQVASQRYYPARKERIRNWYQSNTLISCAIADFFYVNLKTKKTGFSVNWHKNGESVLIWISPPKGQQLGAPSRYFCCINPPSYQQRKGAM